MDNFIILTVSCILKYKANWLTKKAGKNLLSRDLFAFFSLLSGRSCLPRPFSKRWLSLSQTAAANKSSGNAAALEEALLSGHSEEPNSETDLPLQLRTARQNALQTTYTFITFQPNISLDPQLFQFRVPEGFRKHLWLLPRDQFARSISNAWSVRMSPVSGRLSGMIPASRQVITSNLGGYFYGHENQQEPAECLGLPPVIHCLYSPGRLFSCSPGEREATAD